MEEVTAALDAAQWKEIVTVEAQQGQQTVALVASLDVQNGGLQWNPITTQDELVERHFQAKQWILPMLHDEKRNQLYYKAIQEALTKLDSSSPSSSKNEDKKDEEKPPLHILDLGCGTGLLGMIAAQLCPTARITSVDMSTVMVQMTEQTLVDNKNQFPSLKNITVLEGHSTQMLPMRADLCVSELLEDGLLGEGWLPAIRDVWKRHLKKAEDGQPAPVVIPCGANVFAQIIQGEWLSNYVGPRPFVMKNGNTLRHPTNSNTLPVPSSDTSVRDQTPSFFVDSKTVVPMHVGPLMETAQIIPLSEPIELIDFDVSQADHVPGPEGRQVHRTITATREGTVHAILVWWNLSLTPKVVYSLHPHRHENKPSAKLGDDDDDISSFQDHWHPCVHVLESPVQIQNNQTLTIKTRHDDYSIQLSLQSSSNLLSDEEDHDVVESAAKRERIESGLSLPYAFSPGRIWQLNHKERLTAFEKGIGSALRELQKHPSLTFAVDLSDYCVGGLLTAAMAPPGIVPIVYSLERIEAKTVIQSIQLNNMQKNMQVWQGHFEQITTDTLAPGSNPEDPIKKNLLVVAEPSYKQLNYWPHLEALQFYYVIRGLYKRLEKNWNIQVVPQRARLWAAALESHDLAKAYGTRDVLKEKFGLDHSHVITSHFGSSSQRELSLPLWQYNYRLLSEPAELVALPYDGSSTEAQTKIKCPLSKSGTCHGVVVWAQYDHTNNDEASVATNHPCNLGTRQAIYLWKDIEMIDVEAEAARELQCEMIFDENIPNGFTMQFAVVQ